MPRGHGERRWRAFLEEWARSGETIVGFCERRGLRPPTFYEWRRRLAIETSGFVPIEVKRSPAEIQRGSGIEVLLRGGRRVRVERGFDPEVLAQAVAALEALPC